MVKLKFEILFYQINKYNIYLFNKMSLEWINDECNKKITLKVISLNYSKI
jgi:hypothetical protein